MYTLTCRNKLAMDLVLKLVLGEVESQVHLHYTQQLVYELLKVRSELTLLLLFCRETRIFFLTLSPQPSLLLLQSFTPILGPTDLQTAPQVCVS